MDAIIYSIVPLLVPIAFILWVLSKILAIANNVKVQYNSLIPKKHSTIASVDIGNNYQQDDIENVIHNNFDDNSKAIAYYQNVIESFPKNANGEVADEYRHTDDYIKAVKFLTNNV